MRSLWLALAALTVLAGCAPKSKVLPEEAVEFRAFRRIGASPFGDKTGRGPQVAVAIEAALEGAGYEPVDHKELLKVLEEHKPDRELGLGIEALELLRTKVGADAVVFGRMAPDWSFATVTLVEGETGNSVLHAIMRPRKGKAFASPDDVGAEFVRILSKLK